MYGPFSSQTTYESCFLTKSLSTTHPLTMSLVGFDPKTQSRLGVDDVITLIYDRRSIYGQCRFHIPMLSGPHHTPCGVQDYHNTLSGTAVKGPHPLHALETEQYGEQGSYTGARAEQDVSKRVRRGKMELSATA